MTVLKKRAYTNDEFSIISQVSDDKGKTIKLSTIKDGSKMSCLWSPKEARWFILKFHAEETRNYKLKITFQSRDTFFDKFEKEIYLIQDYDPASLPWLYLLQRVSLIAIMLSFVGLIFLI